MMLVGRLAATRAESGARCVRSTSGLARPPTRGTRVPRHERNMDAGAGTSPAAPEPTVPAYRASASRYLIDARDWPSPRRAAASLSRWLAEADEVRIGLGGRAARRFLDLLYVAEEARAA